MKLKQHQKYVEELLSTESSRMKKLNQIVADAIQEESLLTENLSKHILENPKLGEIIADKVASFGGSWKFIVWFWALLIVWVIINSIAVFQKHFDPYPFTLMNVVLSCIAALQAPIIMMSQNRSEAKDRKRAENEYLINLKAEIEIRNLNKKLDLLMDDQLKNILELQKVQMDLIERVYLKLDKLSDKNHPPK